MSGILFVVSAPSGAGKTSLVKGLIHGGSGVRLSVSFTTRAPRSGEVDGRDYHFVARERFIEMQKAGEFLESAEVYGNLYGTSHRWVGEQLALGQDVLLEIDTQGAAQVRKLFPECIGIFILPPSLEVLESRLRGRGQDSAEVIARRLAAARGEMAHAGAYDYVIINDELGEAIQDFASIVRAERLRTPRQVSRHGALFNPSK
ncbi:MAG TPA: guanylate kinase [Burkholderiales bacterium]